MTDGNQDMDGDRDENEGATDPLEPAMATASAGELRVSMRNYFSTHPLWSARSFARKSREIEDSDASGFHLEHRSLVVGSIISSAAFLEAMILYQDAFDGHGLTGPWWPDHALGAGCADWAFSSTLGLSNSVVATLGIEPNYRRLWASWFDQ